MAPHFLWCKEVPRDYNEKCVLSKLARDTGQGHHPASLITLLALFQSLHEKGLHLSNLQGYSIHLEGQWFNSLPPLLGSRGLLLGMPVTLEAKRWRARKCPGTWQYSRLCKANFKPNQPRSSLGSWRAGANAASIYSQSLLEVLTHTGYRGHPPGSEESYRKHRQHGHG